MEIFKELPNVPTPIGPYSVATKFNGVIYCSGQVGINPQTNKIVEGGIENELNQVLKNLENVLIGVGTTKDKILMTTIFLTEIKDGPIVNKIYGEFVSKVEPPARQTVAVKALPLGANVEISLIVAG